MQPTDNVRRQFDGTTQQLAPLGQPASNVPLESSPAIGSPQLAGDADLIEDEWVEAAKRIMLENRHDPFSQNHAMNLLRKDYMKKRYGENIRAAN